MDIQTRIINYVCENLIRCISSTGVFIGLLISISYFISINYFPVLNWNELLVFFMVFSTTGIILFFLYFIVFYGVGCVSLLHFKQGYFFGIGTELLSNKKILKIYELNIVLPLTISTMGLLINLWLARESSLPPYDMIISWMTAIFVAVIFYFSQRDFATLITLIIPHSSLIFLIYQGLSFYSSIYMDIKLLSFGILLFATGILYINAGFIIFFIRKKNFAIFSAFLLSITFFIFFFGINISKSIFRAYGLGNITGATIILNNQGKEICDSYGIKTIKYNGSKLWKVENVYILLNMGQKLLIQNRNHVEKIILPTSAIESIATTIK